MNKTELKRLHTKIQEVKTLKSNASSRQLGRLLKMARKQKGYSRGKVVKLLGVPRENLALIEQGLIDDSDINTIKGLGSFLEMPQALVSLFLKNVQ